MYTVLFIHFKNNAATCIIINESQAESAKELINSWTDDAVKLIDTILGTYDASTVVPHIVCTDIELPEGYNALC